MDWITTNLEKYPPGTKKKWSGHMNHWRKASDYGKYGWKRWEFVFKQKMKPKILDEKDPINNQRLVQNELRRKRWKGYADYWDGQTLKEFLIWDYNCQFIKLIISDNSDCPYLPQKGNHFTMYIDSTDDGYWWLYEVPIEHMKKVMSFVQKNVKILTLDMIEQYCKTLTTL